MFLLFTCVFFAQEKEILHQEFFKDGSIQHEWITFREKPIKYWKTFFKDTNKYFQRNFDKHGNVVAEGWMLSEEKVDFWKVKISKQSMAKGKYHHNKRAGEWRFYTGEHLDSIGSYKNGNKINIWQSFDEVDRLVSEKKYLESIGTYSFSNYYPNGVVKSKGSYLNFKKNGLWEVFSKSRILLTSGFYKNGLKQGYWHYYSLQGSKIKEGRFEGEQKEKWWSFFNHSGHLIKKCQFKKNQLHGFCVYYQKDKIVKGVFFKKGIKIKEWTDWESFKRDYKTLDE